MKITTISVDHLKSSTNQPAGRATDIDALAASIRQIGIIQPIIVRGTAPNFEIVAGHRRVAAAKKAGMVEVPAIITSGDQTDAQVVRISENIHRKQLNPFEEAEAIELLQAMNRTPEQIGADLGMTPSYVARRARLLNLHPGWVKRWKDGPLRDNGNPVTTAHLEIISRYDLTRQKSLLEKYSHWTPTLEGLKRDLANQDQDLALAPWDRTDETLIPAAGACSNCPKRSGAQPLLFSDDATAKGKAADKCLDPKCFDAKIKAHVKAKEVTAAAMHPHLVRISSTYYNQKGIIAKGDYKECTSTHPKARAAIFVDGPKAGTVRWIAPEPGAEAPKPGKATFKPPTDRDRRERLINRRSAHVVKQILERMEKQDYPIGLAFQARGITSPDKAAVFNLSTAMALTLTFGLDACGDDWCDLIKRTNAKTTGHLMQEWWDRFKHEAVGRLEGAARTGEDATRELKELAPLLALLGLRRDDLDKQAAADIPDRHGLLSPAKKQATKPPRSPKVKAKTKPEPKTTAKTTKARKAAKRG